MTAWVRRCRAGRASSVAHAIHGLRDTCTSLCIVPGLASRCSRLDMTNKNSAHADVIHSVRPTGRWHDALFNKVDRNSEPLFSTSLRADLEPAPTSNIKAIYNEAGCSKRLNSSALPLNTFRSTGPLIPLTRPRFAYCQNNHGARLASGSK